MCVREAGRCVRVQPRVCTPPAAVLYGHTPAWFPLHAALTHPRTRRVVPPWGLWHRAPRGPRGSVGGLQGPWALGEVSERVLCVFLCLSIACVRACDSGGRPAPASAASAPPTPGRRCDGEPSPVQKDPSPGLALRTPLRPEGLGYLSITHTVPGDGLPASGWHLRALPGPGSQTRLRPSSLASEDKDALWRHPRTHLGLPTQRASGWPFGYLGGRG